MLLALTRSDLRVRYGRGPVRRIKWLLDPIAALLVYLLLIAFVIDADGRAAGLSIACAVVPFQLVMMTAASSMRAVELRRAIVGNMAFRRTLIPVATTLTEGVGFLACMAMLPIMMAVYGVAPTPAILLLPLVMAVTFAFALALAYPTTLLGLWMPEMQSFVISGVRTLFFIAPSLVALDEVFGLTHDLLVVNPLTGIFEGWRAIFLEGSAPAWWHLAVPLAYSAVLAAIVVPLYRREQRHFAKLVG